MLSKASASKNSNFDPFANTTPHPAWYLIILLWAVNNSEEL